MIRGGQSLLRKGILFIFISCTILLLLFTLPKNETLTSAFLITEKPTAIVRGTNGSALTINISFGDKPIKDWINQLEKPYPLLFVDLNWAERFPEITELIKQKKIPIGLLGHEGKSYETDPNLLDQQIERYEKLFDEKPLWFRTSDEVFPDILHTQLLNKKINALGSTFQWSNGKLPKETDGEIIAISIHQENQFNATDFKKLTDERDFKTLEEVLFGPVGKTKKIPK